jgi:hypothetical protein
MATEGVRRLSLVLGLIFAVPWGLAWGLLAYEHGEESFIYFAFTPGVFVLPWGAVRVTGWVIEGFRHSGGSE